MLKHLRRTNPQQIPKTSDHEYEQMREEPQNNSRKTVKIQEVTNMSQINELKIQKDYIKGSI